MSDQFDWRKLRLPTEVQSLLASSPKVIWASTADELAALAVGPEPHALQCELAYDVPNKGRVVEAVVTKVRNGLSVNYPEPYMRRREPDCLFIADARPSDKPRFQDRF